MPSTDCGVEWSVSSYQPIRGPLPGFAPACECDKARRSIWSLIICLCSAFQLGHFYLGLCFKGSHSSFLELPSSYLLFSPDCQSPCKFWRAIHTNKAPATHQEETISVVYNTQTKIWVTLNAFTGRLCVTLRKITFFHRTLMFISKCWVGPKVSISLHVNWGFDHLHVNWGFDHLQVTDCFGAKEVQMNIQA